MSKFDMDKVYTEEAALLAKVTEWLAPQERRGVKVLRICDRYAKGYADLFICVNGTFVCAELKDDEGVASPHQILFLKQMAEAGAVVGVCRTLGEVAELVNQAQLRSFV